VILDPADLPNFHSSFPVIAMAVNETNLAQNFQEETGLDKIQSACADEAALKVLSSVAVSTNISSINKSTPAMIMGLADLHI
jgi:hypothetical protein